MRWAILILLGAVAPYLAAGELMKPVVKIEARPFEVSQVKLLGGPFQRAQEMGHKYLLDLEPDRLLAPFYETAKLQPKKPRYGGWESQQISGHILGHWLSGATWMAQVTGDQELKKRVDYVVSELAALQAKQTDGYVSGFSEEPFQKVFTGDFQVESWRLAGHWVPWYTMHKLFAGLIDAYQIGGNQQALKVLKKLANWAKAGTDKLTDEQFQKMLLCEQGGMSESMAELFAITGESKYLDLAKRFTHHQILDPLAAAKDELAGRHANTQIPKISGASRIYELTGDDYYHDAASYFWDEVVNKRSYAFGGNSIGEHFGPLGEEPLGPNTAETCNTYNMLRLTKNLMGWKEDSSFGDYYERALYNHILASQDPDTGMMMYFLSTKPGHFKVYSTPFDSMWCCTGTGMENPGRYTEAIYFHDDDTLWVNLYIASELRWKDKGVTLRQETDFPESSRARLTFVEASKGKLSLKLRVPYWANGEMVAQVNGMEAGRAKAGAGWITITRVWAKGDAVELSLPMGLHLQRAVDDPAKAAIMFGPIVLAGEMGKQDFPADDHFKDQNEPNAYPAPAAPALVSDLDLSKWLKPVEGKKLTFQTVGVGKPADIELIPLYQLHHQRYTIYFNVMTSQQWADRQEQLKKDEKALKALDARTVDQVLTGQQQSDIDHHMLGERSSAGVANGQSWRHAMEGGWFSYQVKVASTVTNVLRVTYWGGDSGARDFDILVDGQKIAEQKLGEHKAQEFFDVDYAVPEDLINGKKVIEVKFQAKPGNAAGGIYDLRVLRK